MKSHLVLGMHAVLVLGSFSPARAEDYQTFAQGLEKSSVTINEVHFPGLIYSIDEQTARQYFNDYFATHRNNRALRVNLGYPVFHWGDNHRPLQKALSSVLTERLDRFFGGKDRTAISRVMSGDKDLHNHYFYMLCFLVDLLGSDKIDPNEKQEIGQRLYEMLKASRLCERQYQHLPPAKYPIINLLKAQLLLTCFSYATKCKQRESLDPLLKQQAARRLLLDRYDLLVIDNAFFDDLQLKAVLTYMEAIPSHLRYPIAVTCYDKLAGEVPGGAPVSVHDFACSANHFNVFATRVGSSPNNQFPADSPEVTTDGFMIVFAHEHSHGVDGGYILKDPALGAYRKRVLEKAGERQENYLRSMFGDRFFRDNPQEFVASIANMYFCSSDATFAYALDKARTGNYNQLNQFLLIASAYADEASCPFYRIEPNGRTTVRRYAVRKTDGIITMIAYRGREIRFTTSHGVVTGCSLLQPGKR
jgi:hypothetical protein